MATDTIPASFLAVAGDLSTLSLSPLFELVLGCRLTFSERLDDALLAHAVRLVLDIEPVLGSWLDEGLLSGTWRRCEDLDDNVPFSVVETDDPEAASIAFHAARFEEHGPRLEVRVFRSPSADDLCLRLDHVAGDGWSMKQVAYLLADTYCQLLRDDAYKPEPRISARPSYADVWDALTDEKKRAAESKPRMATPRWRMGIVRSAGDNLSVRRLVLEPERLNALKSYASTRGATVNDVLVGALLRSLARRYPPREGTVLAASVSADLRRSVGEASPFDRVCILASPRTVGIPYAATDDFDTTVSNVIAAIRPWKAASWGIAGMRGRPMPHRLVRGMWRLFTRVAGANGTLPPVVMNIGVLDEPRLRFGEQRPVSAHVLGSFGKAPGFGMTVTTFIDTLTVWMGAWDRDVDPHELEAVLAGMDEQLAQAGTPSNRSGAQDQRTA